MRRRLLLGVAALALLGVAGFALFLWLTTPTPGVTWDNFHRLRVGMSERDVKAMFGEPNETRFGPLPGGWADLPRWKGKALTGRKWRGEEIIIVLTIDPDQRLWDGAAASREEDFGTPDVELVPPDESLLPLVRRWLPW